MSQIVVIGLCSFPVSATSPVTTTQASRSLRQMEMFIGKCGHAEYHKKYRIGGFSLASG